MTRYPSVVPVHLGSSAERDRQDKEGRSCGRYTFGRSAYPRRGVGVAAVTTVAMALSSAAVSRPAWADTAPTTKAPVTVSADVLPTVQIDGVVWAQVVVGKTVYVTGKFTSARPAGAAAGTQETPRSNILAFDLTTGALKTSWAPSLNAQGLGITASSDGKKIIVVGDFTSVNGTSRYRIAELDATTGAVVSSFAPSLDARARALAVVGDTVYVGGSFATASGRSRGRLAAFSTSTGAVLDWAPKANAEVMTMTAPPGSTKLVVGGRFSMLNGTSAPGMGAVDARTGATLAWSANQTIRNYGNQAAINSLHSDGSQVYGTGYYYQNGGQVTGNLEGYFAASVTTGKITWINDCKGDSYDSAPINGVLYVVSHAHDCGMVKGNPEVNPRTYQRAMATTTSVAADGRVNTYVPPGYPGFKGWPASEILHWLPTLTPGSFTGQTQAAWTATATSDYLVLGGEFPKVNGIAQQGLARFAVKSVAPNKSGPQGAGELGLSVMSMGSGSYRASFKAAWDRDNRRLTYELLRGNALATAVVVASTQFDSAWWNRPTLSLTDKTAPSGTNTYRLRVKDPLGNSVVSPAVTPGPGW